MSQTCFNIETPEEQTEMQSVRHGIDFLDQSCCREKRFPRSLSKTKKPEGARAFYLTLGEKLTATLYFERPVFPTHLPRGR